MSNNLPYNPDDLKREMAPYYISMTDSEQSEILKELGLEKESDVFASINENVKMPSAPTVPPRLDYNDLKNHVEELSQKNKLAPCFIGDGLTWYKQASIVPKVCNVRGLTTAYTPYQPERSQGTLHTLWLYSSSISMLTGFEAINSSLYERSTCLFEAFNTSLRLKRGSTHVLVSQGIYPGDLEVINTQAKGTKLEIITYALNPITGMIDLNDLKEKIEKYSDKLAAIAFPQVNTLGVLEDVDQLTDLASEHKLSSIALIDPFHLTKNGLKKPADFGSEKQGTTMIVGEGQALCLGRNFGGPGLGIFGIRYNQKVKNAIRSTAGRYVGKAKDEKGKDCLSMVLSTREQHIRREKATSNICSNQSFVATIAGAAMLEWGDEGMAKKIELAKSNTNIAVSELTSLEGIELAFKESYSFNEVTFELNCNVDELINNAAKENLQIGINVSDRINSDKQLLKCFFNDQQTEQEVQQFLNFFRKSFSKGSTSETLKEIPSAWLRDQAPGIQSFNLDELDAFYNKLGNMNVSPDDNIYPLGSCTMKYNPYINDYAASLTGFTEVHPQAPEMNAQGSLEVLYQIQEMFKGITGLQGVTTQPVAGAQGELVGVKMFQAYHEDRGQGETRNAMLIPKSAHGTNPATAVMAGYEKIITLNATPQGEIDTEELKTILAENGDSIAGIMITNPNTSGVFERNFKEIAEMVHEAGGLVYMDGANMNAIAGIVDLDKLGVDAVHNNLHKTWTIPHGGGGPGDAIVAVSSRLVDYMPGVQIKKDGDRYSTFRSPKTIGSFHRHFGNFAHKVRAYTYIRALGPEGIVKMSTVAVLSSQYLFHKLKDLFPTLPSRNETQSRLHEFIITLTDDMFEKIEKAGVAKNQTIAKIGKLFLDFGLHAPTVAFPEQFGLMIEPTESFTKKELDRFIDVLKVMHQIINETPEVLATTPHFTPIFKVDEVGANKSLVLSEKIEALPTLEDNTINPHELNSMELQKVREEIIKAHQAF
jgi:glycine dehydrogenase